MLIYAITQFNSSVKLVKGAANTIAEVVGNDLTNISENKLECIKDILSSLPVDYVIIFSEDNHTAVRIYENSVEYLTLDSIQNLSTSGVHCFNYNNLIVGVKGSVLEYIAPILRSMGISICCLPLVVYVFIHIFRVQSAKVIINPIYKLKGAIESFNDEYAETQTITTIPLDGSKISEDEEFVVLANELNIFANTLVVTHKEMEDTVFISEHDALTGLKNRHGFENDSENYRYSEHSLGLIFIDLNYLKKCNDTLGHEAGDALLKNMATVVSEAIKKFNHDEQYCFGYRFGGDEYAISCWNCEEGTLSKLQEELAKQRDILNQKTNSEPVPLSFAYGAVWRERADMSMIDVQDMISKADKQMYKMKRKMKANEQSN